MPGCIVSATTASFRSVEKRRRRATPVITSTFENVSDIGVCLGLYLGPPAKAGVRSKQGAVQVDSALVSVGSEERLPSLSQGAQAAPQMSHHRQGMPRLRRSDRCRSKTGDSSRA